MKLFYICIWRYFYQLTIKSQICFYFPNSAKIIKKSAVSFRHVLKMRNKASDTKRKTFAGLLERLKSMLQEPFCFAELSYEVLRDGSVVLHNTV